MNPYNRFALKKDFLPNFSFSMMPFLEKESRTLDTVFSEIPLDSAISFASMPKSENKAASQRAERTALSFLLSSGSSPLCFSSKNRAFVFA